MRLPTSSRWRLAAPCPAVATTRDPAVTTPAQRTPSTARTRSTQWTTVAVASAPPTTMKVGTVRASAGASTAR